MQPPYCLGTNKPTCVAFSKVLEIAIGVNAPKLFFVKPMLPVSLIRAGSPCLMTPFVLYISMSLCVLLLKMHFWVFKFYHNKIANGSLLKDDNIKETERKKYRCYIDPLAFTLFAFHSFWIIFSIGKWVPLVNFFYFILPPKNLAWLHRSESELLKMNALLNWALALSDVRTLFLTICSSLYTRFLSLRKSKITHRFWAFAQFIRAMCPALLYSTKKHQKWQVKTNLCLQWRRADVPPSPISWLFDKCWLFSPAVCRLGAVMLCASLLHTLQPWLYRGE